MQGMRIFDFGLSGIFGFGSSPLEEELNKIDQPYRSVALRIALRYNCKTTQVLYRKLKALYLVEKEAVAKEHYKNAAAAMQAKRMA